MIIVRVIFLLLQLDSEFKPSTRLAAMSHKLTIEMSSFNHDLEANSFLSRTSSLWNSLPVCFFTARFDLRFDHQFDFLLLFSLLNVFRYLYSFTLRNVLVHLLPCFE